MDVRIVLNEKLRDRLLILTCVESRVNSFLLARIFAHIHQLNDEEIDTRMKRWRNEELSLLARQLEAAARDEQPGNLLGLNPFEEDEGLPRK